MRKILLASLFSCCAFLLPASAETHISGEQKLWHTITLAFTGPDTSESATPNPFTDYRLNVTFTNSGRSLVVPGYWAADGDAANSSADSGNRWHTHFAPDATGEWTWTASFRQGNGVAVSEDPGAGTPLAPVDGSSGTFTVGPSDKSAPDLRALGRLDYVGSRYLRTKGNGEIFLKAGADAPENFLSYKDFDGAFATDGIKDNLVKTWKPHVRDWKEGDPTWGGGKGKGIIGAVNYLAGKGMNAFSFLTMNINGDDRNAFPYLTYEDRDRLDVSRLAQWETVFEHASTKGMFLHFKTQETENECLLDGGDLGPQRRLYYRELIARFAHHPALNWNLGEENGNWGKGHHKKNLQTSEQRAAMARYFAENDPYKHPIVCHNGQWPDDLYGDKSALTGWSLQTNKTTFENVHSSTLKILNAAEKAGKPWAVACDEPGDASHSLIPDDEDPGRDNARTNALWGVFLAGGWGIEWYFGYKHPHSDLTCQDYRSRDKMWDQSAHALHLLRANNLPLEEMRCHDALLEGSKGFCLAKPGDTYVALIKNPDTPSTINLEAYEGTAFTLEWYDPRNGGKLQPGTRITGGSKAPVGLPPSEHSKDWVALVRKDAS